MSEKRVAEIVEELSELDDTLAGCTDTQIANWIRWRIRELESEFRKLESERSRL